MTVQLRRNDLEWKQIDDEIVVLDARAGTYIAINGAGALLWSSLASGATREQLAQTLIQTYAVDESRALADTEEFVAALSEQGLLAS